MGGRGAPPPCAVLTRPRRPRPAGRGDRGAVLVRRATGAAAGASRAPGGGARRPRSPPPARRNSRKLVVVRAERRSGRIGRQTRCASPVVYRGLATGRHMSLCEPSVPRSLGSPPWTGPVSASVAASGRRGRRASGPAEPLRDSAGSRQGLDVGRARAGSRGRPPDGHRPRRRRLRQRRAVPERLRPPCPRGPARRSRPPRRLRARPQLGRRRWDAARARVRCERPGEDASRRHRPRLGHGQGHRLLDLTLDGHRVLSSGIAVRQVEGAVVQRVAARNLRNWGVIVDANVPGLEVARLPLVEDIVASDVTWPVRHSSKGNSEACVWIGNTAVVRRVLPSVAPGRGSGRERRRAGRSSRTSG